jgi:TonB family protein
MLKTKYEGVVRLRATITEEGLADQIIVIGAPNPAFADSAIATAQGWHFNPAIGADGKPLSVRMPVDVTFRVRH